MSLLNFFKKRKKKSDVQQVLEIAERKFGENFVLHSFVLNSIDEMLSFVHSLSFENGVGKDFEFDNENLQVIFIGPYSNNQVHVFIGGQPNEEENYEIISKLSELTIENNIIDTSSEGSSLSKDLKSACGRL